MKKLLFALLIGLGFPILVFASNLPAHVNVGDMLQGGTNDNIVRTATGTKGSLWNMGTLPGWFAPGADGTVLTASSTAVRGLAWTSVGGTGTVTSVDMTVPTGLSVSGNPITTSGTLALSLQTGYNIPLTASTTNWNTAYGWGNHASAGYLTSAVTSLNSQTGASQTFATTSSGSIFNLTSSGNVHTFTIPTTPTFTGLTTTNASTTNLTVTTNAYFPNVASQNCLGTSATGLLQAGTCGASSGNAAWTIGASKIYNATSTDLVGIGTNTPTTTLFVQGNTGANPFAISSSTGTQLLTVLQNGNIGVGTTTPTARIHVQGTATDQNYTLFAISSSTGANILSVSPSSFAYNTTYPSASFHVANGLTPSSTVPVGITGTALFDGWLATPGLSVGNYQNFILQTEAFDNASWVKVNVGTVTSNTATSPIGSLIAENIPTGTNATSSLVQALSNTSSSTSWTFSVWLKSQNTSNTTTSLSIGTNTASGTPKSLVITPQWQRYFVTATFTTHTTKYVYITNGTSAISAWGAQFEPSPNANPYSGARTTTGLTAITSTMYTPYAFQSAGAGTFGGAGSFTGAMTISGALSGATTGAFSGTVTITQVASSTGTKIGELLTNTTAAVASSKYFSPALGLRAFAWSTGISQSTSTTFYLENRALTQTTGTGALTVTHEQNNASNTLLTVLGTGQTGIGSSVPYSLLTVQGTTTAPTMIPLTVASSSGAVLFQVNTNGSTTISSLGAGPVYSTASGSLYVGTAGSGITSLNGLTGASQTFATSTSGGLSLVITSSATTHTFTLQPATNYTVPLTASTTEWTNFYNTPSTRITAGTNLVWSTNTLNVTSSPSFTGTLNVTGLTTLGSASTTNISVSGDLFDKNNAKLLAGIPTRFALASTTPSPYDGSTFTSGTSTIAITGLPYPYKITEIWGATTRAGTALILCGTGSSSSTPLALSTTVASSTASLTFSAYQTAYCQIGSASTSPFGVYIGAKQLPQ